MTARAAAPAAGTTTKKNSGPRGRGPRDASRVGGPHVVNRPAWRKTSLLPAGPRGSRPSGRCSPGLQSDSWSGRKWVVIAAAAAVRPHVAVGSKAASRHQDERRRCSRPRANFRRDAGRSRPISRRSRPSASTDLTAAQKVTPHAGAERARLRVRMRHEARSPAASRRIRMPAQPEPGQGRPSTS